MTIYASMRKSTDNNIKTEVYECPSHLKNHHEDERDRDFFPEAVELLVFKLSKSRYQRKSTIKTVIKLIMFP